MRPPVFSQLKTVLTLCFSQHMVRPTHAVSMLESCHLPENIHELGLHTFQANQFTES